MLVCLEPTLVPWRPNLAGQESPEWTKLVCDGVELCNSLEASEWWENPVQVKICEACGTPHCASGGYVHVTRLGDHLLWTQPCESVMRRGAVLIPSAVWSELAKTFSNLLPFKHIPETRQIDLLHAWISETRGASCVESLDALEPMLRERLLACDSIDVQEALRVIGAFVNRTEEDLLARVDGHFRPASDAAARIETLYFDGPADEDWPALAFMPSMTLAFGRDWVFEPSRPV